jgi:hypothetical protein
MPNVLAGAIGISTDSFRDWILARITRQRTWRDKSTSPWLHGSVRPSIQANPGDPEPVFHRIDSQRTFERRLAQLSDLSLSADPELATFGGTVRYCTTFTLDSAGFDARDLGPLNGVTDVRLNDRALGVRRWGRHRHDISGA